MREPLTRAQVEELAQRAAAWTDGVEMAAWLATDAALRAQVAALVQRIEAEEPIFHAMVQALAAMTQDRDGWKRQHEMNLDAWMKQNTEVWKRQVNESLFQKLAALELANTTLHEEVTKLEKMLYPGGT